MNEIQVVKVRIDTIDQQIHRLQQERLILGLRHSALLKQAALANPPVETVRQRSIWYDDLADGSGFEESL